MSNPAPHTGMVCSVKKNILRFYNMVLFAHVALVWLVITYLSVQFSHVGGHGVGQIVEGWVYFICAIGGM